MWLKKYSKSQSWAENLSELSKQESLLSKDFSGMKENEDMDMEPPQVIIDFIFRVKIFFFRSSQFLTAIFGLMILGI